MIVRARVASVLVLLTVIVPTVGVVTATAAAPRPGCGYGDSNHAHQAAPGQDPLNLRPGGGAGDPNHPHTAPPGQAPVTGGDQSGPMRGCRADTSRPANAAFVPSALSVRGAA